MMIGVPSVEIPRWPVSVPLASSHTQHHHLQDDSSASPSPSPTANLAAFAVALQRYLPRNSNNMRSDDYQCDGDCHDMVDDDVPLLDAFTCDEFRMYEFKVRRCARGRSHDWTQCPYAHPGEKARRRDPRKFHYSGTACPEFRKGSCRKGDSCEFAHGVFECWLHPSRYRTQPCKDGVGCRRRVCFFAHTPEQLRVLPTVEGFDGSPMRKARGGGVPVMLSPTSSLVGPVSPSGSSGVGSPPVSPTVDEVVLEMRKLQLCNMAKAAGRGVGWDLRHQQQQQQMRYERGKGFDGWYGEPGREKANLAESSVDEPAWFSDIVN